MESVVKLYSLPYSNVKTYGAALLFVIGNIALPLLTAIASPLINSALFGMPAPSALPAILLKSVLLAAGAGFVAYRFQKVSVLALLAVVLFYQCVGTLGEWAFFADSFHAAVQDFRMGIPGMLLQVFGGYAFIRYLIQK